MVVISQEEEFSTVMKEAGTLCVPLILDWKRPEQSAQLWAITEDLLVKLIRLYAVNLSVVLKTVTSEFGNGHSQILPLHIQCESEHETLRNCHMQPWSISQCSNAAGVICDGNIT